MRVLFTLFLLVQLTCAVDDLHAGTWRPNLYFGTRTRSPQPLLTGLMWFGPDFQFRHQCEQDDQLIYAWKKFDPRSIGIQEIVDEKNHVKITTVFYNAGEGKWVARISGKASGQQGVPVTVIFYAAIDGDGSLRLNGNVLDSNLFFAIDSC